MNPGRINRSTTINLTIKVLSSETNMGDLNTMEIRLAEAWDKQTELAIYEDKVIFKKQHCIAIIKPSVIEWALRRGLRLNILILDLDRYVSLLEHMLRRKDLKRELGEIK